MNQRAWLRLGAKTVHDVASIAFGGALAACLVINLTANIAAPADFLAGRHIFAAIARYMLVPAMAVVTVSGLIALTATRGYREAGWAWLKALLGMNVFAATLLLAGSAGNQGEIAAAVSAADLDTVQRLLRSERITLWLLIVLVVVNVALAVWRPRLAFKAR
jgi:fermentation-respiration switch protein FrsA (DUF1100 family)